MRVLSVGEILWDVFTDQERLGGAPLNFCANLHRMGDIATLLSAVGDDERGWLARTAMRGLGLGTEHVTTVVGMATGTAVIGTAVDGEPNFVISRPAAFDRLATGKKLVDDAAAAGPDWLYFGTLLQTEPAVEEFTTSLAERLHRTRCFYDMNLRTGHWNLDLVQRLSKLASIIKLNEQEAEILFKLTETDGAAFSLESFCERWSATHGVDMLCVTLGSLGCLIYKQRTASRVPGYKVTVCDTVGSGDAFAAAFLHGFHLGWPTLDTARFANALGALVASRAGATPEWTMAEVLELVSGK